MTNTYPANAVRDSGASSWLGVEVFFVISGFIIPYSLFIADYRVSHFHRFVLKRILRLEPPYIVSILLVIILWHLSAITPGFRGEALSYTLPQIAAHLFYLIPLTRYTWLSPVYWTLFYEFVFYISVGLLYPLIIRSHVLVVYTVFVLIFGAITIIGGPPWIIIMFLLGIAGFRYFTKVDSLVVFTLVSAISTVSLSCFGGPSGIIEAIAGLSAILIILFVEIPQYTVFKFLGSISYSLYLLHIPIGGRVVNLGRRYGEGVLFDFGLSFLAILVSVTAATIYWRWIERPSQLASNRITY